MPPVAREDRLVWIDLEMTGLDAEHDVIVEIACIVTDSNLVALDDGIQLVVHQDEATLARMDDFVRTMHTKSGLLDEIATAPSDTAKAEKDVLAYVQQHVSLPRAAPMCGNSIGMDRRFLAKYMPELDNYVHYRSVDVSSFKELARRWYPAIYRKRPGKAEAHRALGDIQESIEELRYYRDAVFVPLPGPDSASARTIAAKHQAAITGAVQPDAPASHSAPAE
jgi:oligoribonuclease